MLSADENSLSNLDQDLPNNMIHQLPIYSLPQEWLWCETWCSDEELVKAKTIDLCNNPLTKEPKLDRARRLLPEWEGLDQEVESVKRKVFGSVSLVSKETGSSKTLGSTETLEEGSLMETVTTEASARATDVKEEVVKDEL